MTTAVAAPNTLRQGFAKGKLCGEFKPFDRTRTLGGAVRLMRTRIRLQAQPEPMRSIIDATQ